MIHIQHTRPAPYLRQEVKPKAPKESVLERHKKQSSAIEAFSTVYDDWIKSSLNIQSPAGITSLSFRQMLLQSVPEEIGSTILSDPAKAEKNSRLHQAVLQGNCRKIEQLLARGADVNAKNEFKQTPLHLAAYMGNRPIAMLLIQQGGATFESDRLLGLRPTDYAPDNETYRLLLNMEMYLQANNLKTNGLSRIQQIDIKQSLIESQTDTWPTADIEKLKKGRNIDLFCMDSDNSPESKTETLQKAIKDLKPNDYLLLANGTLSHAIDILLRRNANGQLQVTLFNKGEGADRHDQDGARRIYPKTFIFNPGKSKKTIIDQCAFENRVAEQISKIYEKDQNAWFFSSGGYYRDMNKLLGHGVEELHQDGRPQVRQKADNCATQSQLAAFNYLAGDKARFGEVKANYKRYLEREISALAPEMTREKFDQILASQKQHLPPAWLQDRAWIALQKADDKTNSPDYRLEKYKLALERFEDYQEINAKKAWFFDRFTTRLMINICLREIDKLMESLDTKGEVESTTPNQLTGNRSR